MQQNHQTPILQSPARLGLTNPNSPSLSNPATPKLSTQTPQHQHFVPHHQQQQQQQQQQQTPSTTPTLPTTTTSSALLPLLPPLSRAQSILLQMAALATKLFEVSPHRSMWLSSYRGSLPTFLPSQYMPQPHDSSSSPSTTKEVLSQFSILQTQLFEAVAQLQEILDLQDAKQKIASDIRSKDSAMRAFAHKMKEAEHVLDLLVDDYSDYRRPQRSISTTNSDGTATTDSSSSASDTTITSSLRLSDIMSYAHRISYTTFAPPEYGAGVAPLRGAMPPAPQEEQMRASQLYNFADLDVGLPKTDESKKKAIETLIEAAPPHPIQPSDANQLLDLAAIQGLIPPQLSVPSGWRPGMPVELPTDIPLVPPPGWKPGDPVPLPSLDSIVLPSKREEQQQQPRPVVPQMPPPKAPEPIQVRHVQLDIDGGGNDSDSEYSSDTGSSEEDDED